MSGHDICTHTRAPLPIMAVANDDDAASPRDPKTYWGDLFKPDRSPAKRLEELLMGLAGYIAENIDSEDESKEAGSPLQHQRRRQTLAPAKLAAFYRAVGGDYDALFLDTPPAALSFIYQSLGCAHALLQPRGEDFAPPSVPALETRGFTRWQCIQLLLDPVEHRPFLQQAVKRFDIVNPATGKIFPKEIPSEAFPDKPDGEMTKWHDGVFDRLSSEAGAEQQKEQHQGQKSRNHGKGHHERADDSRAPPEEYPWWAGPQAPPPAAAAAASAGAYYFPWERGPYDIPQRPFNGYHGWDKVRARNDISRGYRNVRPGHTRHRSHPAENHDPEPEVFEVNVEVESDSDGVSPHHQKPKSRSRSTSPSSLSSGNDAADGLGEEPAHQESSSLIGGSDVGSSPPIVSPPVPDPPPPSSPPTRREKQSRRKHRQHSIPHADDSAWSSSNNPTLVAPRYRAHQRRHSDIPLSPVTSPGVFAPMDPALAYHLDYDLATQPRFAHPTGAPTGYFPPFPPPHPHQPGISIPQPSQNPYIPRSLAPIAPPPPRGNYRGRNVRWSNEHSILTFGPPSSSSQASTPGSEMSTSPFDLDVRPSRRSRSDHRAERERERESERRGGRERRGSTVYEEDEDYFESQERRRKREQKKEREREREKEKERAKAQHRAEVRRLADSMSGVAGRRYPVEGIVWR